MKAAYREFLKDTVSHLEGDQDEYQKHAMKAQCRKLLKEDAALRKAKRKAAKKAKRGNR